jgi:hypothetical protein
MFGWLKSLFGGIRYFFATRNSPWTTPVPSLPQESHSNSQLEQLTPYECAYIAHGFAHPNGSQCPDCKEGRLVPGQDGTSALDFVCNHCGAKFRLNLFSEDVFGERVSPRERTICDKKAP